MEKKQMGKPLLLILAAFIWGIAFVAQSVGMDYVGPFTFNAVRSILGGLILIPCMFILNYIEPRKQKTEEKRILILGGICCGVALFAGSTLQQLGIMETSVGKAGFLTSLYIIGVPLAGILLRKKVGLMVWAAVFLASIGFYLLCIKEGFSIGRGDFLVLLGALAFTLHILIIDYFSPKAHGVKLACIQFFVSGLLSMIFMFLLEKPSFKMILAAWQPIAYAGIMSCGVGYTLQIIGQKGVNPSVASLLLSLESVFSVLAGWILLGQTLSLREMIGCVFVFAAVLLAQFPNPQKIKEPK